MNSEERKAGVRRSENPGLGVGWGRRLAIREAKQAY